MRLFSVASILQFMKAIILAAGIGQRLAEVSSGKPKCLLEFDGKSLIRRHIELLEEFGLQDVLIVTGFRADDIRKHIDELNTQIHIKTVLNTDYRSGSSISLYSAKADLKEDEDVILMDADVLYDKRILKALFDTTHADCLLLDQDFEQGEEPVKICVKGGHIVDFRKQIEDSLEFDIQGESVGFFRFSPDTMQRLFARCEDYIRRGENDTPYEEAIRDLLLESPEQFHYEDISGMPWIEIDFPEDVTRAKNEILKVIK